MKSTGVASSRRDAEAQHQKITTFNIAPGYSRVFGSKTLLTANGYVRRDKLIYTPSPDPFANLPGTVAQDRRPTNVGAKVDVAYTSGAHNLEARLDPAEFIRLNRGALLNINAVSRIVRWSERCEHRDFREWAGTVHEPYPVTAAPPHLAPPAPVNHDTEACRPEAPGSSPDAAAASPRERVRTPRNVGGRWDRERHDP